MYAWEIKVCMGASKFAWGAIQNSTKTSRAPQYMRNNDQLHGDLKVCMGASRYCMGISWYAWAVIKTLSEATLALQYMLDNDLLHGKVEVCMGDRCRGWVAVQQC